MDASLHQRVRQYFLLHPCTLDTHEPVCILAHPEALVEITDEIKHAAAREQGLAHVTRNWFRERVVLESLALVRKIFCPEILHVREAYPRLRIAAQCPHLPLELFPVPQIIGIQK